MVPGLGSFFTPFSQIPNDFSPSIAIAGGGPGNGSPGGLGHDFLNGHAGNDLYGNSGMDLLQGVEGNDTLLGHVQLEAFGRHNHGGFRLA